LIDVRIREYLISLFGRIRMVPDVSYPAGANVRSGFRSCPIHNSSAGSGIHYHFCCIWFIFVVAIFAVTNCFNVILHL